MRNLSVYLCNLHVHLLQILAFRVLSSGEAKGVVVEGGWRAGVGVAKWVECQVKRWSGRCCSAYRAEHTCAPVSCGGRPI